MEAPQLSVREASATIVLRLPDPSDWSLAMHIGCAREYGPGVYSYALSVQNLEKIYQTFHGQKKPVVVEGSHVLDKLRAEVISYRKRLKAVHAVVNAERFPVEPNGKFHPYAHQTKAIGVILANPYSPVMLSCGLGKTGSTARAVEILIQNGEITKGKVLVSAPLSILHSSWMDDIEKFTNLKAEVLWTNKANKTVLDDKIRLGRHDLSEAPAGTLTAKKKERTAYFSSSLKKLKLSVTELDLAEAQWEKYKISYQVAVDASGKETPFGDIYGRSVSKENTKSLYIQDRLKNSDADIFLINHDGVRIYEELLTEYAFEWVIVDESTKIKSFEAKVTKAHLNVSAKAKRRNILSGTPNPNGFQDLWSQFYFLDRGMTLGTSSRDFLNEYFVAQITGTYRLPNGVKKEAVTYNLRSAQDRDALIGTVKAPGIFLEQRDCIDLPPRTDMRRAVVMTAEQERAYAEMEEHLFTELEDASTSSSIQVEAANTLSKIMKLRQITSGFLIESASGTRVKIQSPKLDDLDELIEELGNQKLVVACQFREEIEQLLSRYKKIGVAAVYGGVSPEARAEAIRKFQKTDDIRVILLQPQAAAHGITLTAASYLVFLSLDYNFEFYYQTAKRIERIGQKNPIFIIHSVARFADGSSTIDEDLMYILDKKNRERDALFSGDTQSLEEIVSVMRDRIRSRVMTRNKK